MSISPLVGPSSPQKIEVSTPKTPIRKRKQDISSLDSPPFSPHFKTPKSIDVSRVSEITNSILSPSKPKTLPIFDLQEEIRSVSSSNHSFVDSFKTVDPETFFTDKEPRKWYPFFSKENGAISIDIPNHVGSLKKVIYVIRNKKTNQLLIGKTASKVASRLSHYLEVFSSGYSSHLPLYAKEIIENPSSFDFGILYPLKEKEKGDLYYFEQGFIKFKGIRYQLYNKNRGGGGGTSRDEEIRLPYYFSNPATITPEKRYGFVLKNKKITVELTPGFHEKYKKLLEQKPFPQSFVYSFKDIETGCEYIGTTGDIKARLSAHLSKSNRLWNRLKEISNFKTLWKESFGKEKVKQRLLFLMETKKRLKPVYERCKADNPFYQASSLINLAIMARFKQLRFGVFPVFYEDPKTLSPSSYARIETASTIGSVERRFIEARKTVQPAGFNTDLGGNGPIKEQRPRPKMLDFSQFPKQN